MHGYADPSRAAPGLVVTAQRQGALVFQQGAVRGLDISAGKFSGMITGRGLIKTRSMICAAGVWISLFCHRRGFDLSLGNVIGTAFCIHPIGQVVTAP